MTLIPHIAFPVRFVAGVAAAVEQDSPSHQQQRVAITCLTPLGSRADDPTFGIPDQVMRTPGVDLDELAAGIEASEPDIDVTLTTPGSEGHDNPDAVVLDQDIHLHIEGD